MHPYLPSQAVPNSTLSMLTNSQALKNVYRQESQEYLMAGESTNEQDELNGLKVHEGILEIFETWCVVDGEKVDGNEGGEGWVYLRSLSDVNMHVEEGVLRK